MGNGHHVAAQGGALIRVLRCRLDTLIAAELLGKRTAPRAINQVAQLRRSTTCSLPNVSGFSSGRSPPAAGQSYAAHDPFYRIHPFAVFRSWLEQPSSQTGMASWPTRPVRPSETLLTVPAPAHSRSQSTHGGARSIARGPQPQAQKPILVHPGSALLSCKHVLV
jgi:hypothetical protein